MKTSDRITQLETSLRRQRIAIAGLGLGLLATVAIGMNVEVTKELTLEGLTILKDGQPRIVMGTDEQDGGVGLAVLDAQGVSRIALGTDAKGDGGLAVMDAKESPRVLLGSGADGTGIMVVGGAVTEVPAMPADNSK